MRIELLKGIETLEELKSAYRKLAFKYHPDKATGSVELMQQLNNEYEYLSARLKDSKGKTETKEYAAEFIEVINQIINFENITIEIIGSWIWVSGETKPIKDTLKSLKFHWNKTRQLWQRKPTDEKFKTKNSKQSDEWIKDKYGCETVKGNKIYKKCIA